MKNIMYLGSGEGGTRVVDLMHKLFSLNCHCINTSPKDSEKAKSIPEEKKILLEGANGLAKQMQEARKIIIKEGDSIVKKLIAPEIANGINRIMLVTTTGGGTGAGITLELAKAIIDNIPEGLVKIAVTLISPFEYDDGTAFSNTVKLVKFLETMNVPTRIVSNANFMNREMLHEGLIHDKVNKYIAETIYSIVSMPEANTIGRNTDPEEIDKVLFGTPGYTFVARANLSNKNTKQNIHAIITSLKESLDMGFNFDGYYKARLIALYATDSVAAAINMKEINEGIIMNPRASNFFTHLEPKESNYALIVISGCNLPTKIMQLMETLKEMNENGAERKTLEVDYSILDGIKEPEFHSDSKETNIYSKLFSGEDKKSTSDTKSKKNDILKAMDSWNFGS